jgi:hypothetical protein
MMRDPLPPPWRAHNIVTLLTPESVYSIRDGFRHRTINET